MRSKPAVFLDRDGVLNEDRDDYVKSWSEVVFYPGVFDALRRLREAGCEVYLVTNQAGVGKGIMPHRHLRDILLRMRLSVHDRGGLIHGIAYCPHRSDAGCACRKPKPGMLRKLALKYGLDLAQSVIVGDSCGDIAAGQAVGCRTILLHTRQPLNMQEHLEQCPQPPDHQCNGLPQAVELILKLPQFRDSSR